jgi:hypothetical protein
MIRCFWSGARNAHGEETAIFTIRNSCGCGQRIGLRFEANGNSGRAPSGGEVGVNAFIALWAIMERLLSPSSIERCQFAKSTFSRQAVEEMEEKKYGRAVTVLQNAAERVLTTRRV